MKTLRTGFLTVIISLLFSTITLQAAINKNKIVGTWQLSAEVVSDVKYKNWVGSLTITREGKKLTGVLNWSCLEGDWSVIENLNVSIKGNNITLQGTSVNVISHPESTEDYRLDNFTFSMEDVTEQTVAVSHSDSQGVVANFTITKN